MEYSTIITLKEQKNTNQKARQIWRALSVYINSNKGMERKMGIQKHCMESGVF